MREALSIVLAGLLVLLPVEQVLAQAEQQADVRVQQAAPSDPAAHLFRVPPLTENSARLLRTSSDRTLLDTDFLDAALVQEGAFEDWALGWKIPFVTAISAAIVVGLWYLFQNICIDNNNCPD